MRGGSLADRLFPAEADALHLQRLGVATPLRPLSWRERLRSVTQAMEALIYLHTPQPGGKGTIVHRKSDHKQLHNTNKVMNK